MDRNWAVLGPAHPLPRQARRPSTLSAPTNPLWQHPPESKEWLHPFQKSLLSRHGDTVLTGPAAGGFSWLFSSSPRMQSSRFFSASTAYFYFDHGGGISPPPSVTVIPIESPDAAVPIVVHSPGIAAVKIQAACRGHLVRSLVRRVRDADAEADRFELLIRTQEMVDAVRRDERERLRVAEGLMALLLRLDGVPGFYPAVRELRRATSRRIVALQELLDAIVGERIVELEGFPSTWEEVVCGVDDGVGETEMPVDPEERVVRRGFRCLEKFLLGGLQ